MKTNRTRRNHRRPTRTRALWNAIRQTPRLMPRRGRRYRFARGARKRRYRVVNRRRFLIAQTALALVLVTALALSASVIARSIRTARLNRELVQIHTVSGNAPEVEVAAPALERSDAKRTGFGELSMMGMPDGSPIVVAEAAESRSPVDEAAEGGVFHRVDLDMLPDMLELTRRNLDTIGWLSIEGVLHLPVVYRDNTYYLDHDFSGEKNASGTLFLDQYNPLTEATQNLLIHGHSMNDGSMFGTLTHYRRLSFLTAHPLISFSTLWEKDTYAVFAVLLVSSNTQDPDFFNYYSHPTFASDAEFNDYIRQVQARSRFTIPVDVRPTDALLTLSTCIDEKRLVVIARRLRGDETKDELFSAVQASC